MDILNFFDYAPFLYIKTKQSGGRANAIIPFTPSTWWPSQRRLNEILDANEAQRKPTWLLILKARQGGVSTWAEARVFHRAVTNFSNYCLILADLRKRSEYVFDMCKTFYDYLPPILQPPYKYSTRNEMVFDDADGTGLKSKIIISTALDPFVGQSYTVNTLHISELASFPYIADVFTTLIPAIPDQPSTLVIAESTAKGAATEFHREWKLARRGESIFTAVFFPWFVHPEYQMNVPDNFLPLDPEEEQLQKTYNLTLRQLAWRRYTIQKKYRGRVEAFNQEYPSNDDEAFVILEETYFLKDRLKLACENCTDPIFAGNIRVADCTLQPGTQFSPFWIWKMPEPHKKYRVSVDPCGDVPEGDYLAIQVFDDRPFTEQVAEYQGKLDPIDAAYLSIAIAKLYNKARLVIEMNNMGLATVNEVKKHYWNQYQWQYIDRFTNFRTDKLGWQTTPSSKKLMLGYVDHVINDGLVKFNSRRLCSELLTFVKHGVETARAAAGCNDDLVMSMLINLYTSHQEYGKREIGDNARLKERYRVASPRPDRDDEMFREIVKQEDEHWLNL
jgi:hypothetical protein